MPLFRSFSFRQQSDAIVLPKLRLAVGAGNWRGLSVLESLDSIESAGYIPDNDQVPPSNSGTIMSQCHASHRFGELRRRPFSNSDDGTPVD
jgi:hypothetical protein